MLDVDRRPDIDAGPQQFLHVLVALGMAAIGRIGVGEFVDDQQRRLQRQRAVEVELLHGVTMVELRTAGQDLEPVEQRQGLGASVRLDEAHHDRHPLALQLARGGQHRIGLADAGRGTDEDLEPAAPVLARRGQQGVGIRPRVAGLFPVEHEYP